MIEETITPNHKIPLAALKYQLQKKHELRQYVLELKERNPDTTVKIDVERKYEPDSPTRKFRRIYVCLGALKSGFKAGKETYKTWIGALCLDHFLLQILAAIGVDLNNGTYPLAYSVVEYETKQSWLWFLDCLGDDLELFRNSNFTFVTDMQKGFIPALAETFLCAKHRCATTTIMSRFNRNMEELKSANKDVYDWLKYIPPQH
ncbi:mutator type transposase [Tanacetum coccineum]